MSDWLTNPIYWNWIVQGLTATVAITLFGVCLGLLLGTMLAIGDVYGGKALKGIITVYVEFFRGSPLFIQAFIAVYTVPALLNIQINHNYLLFLVFGLNSAGYQKGYIKGAMQTVLDDQMAAGLSGIPTVSHGCKIRRQGESVIRAGRGSLPDESRPHHTGRLRR